MGNLIMKTCSKCGINKNIFEFGKQWYRKDGLNPWCKQCRREYSLSHKELIQNQKSAYYDKNKDFVISKSNDYYSKNRESIVVSRRENYYDNREEILAARRVDRAENADVVKEKKKSYYINRKSKGMCISCNEKSDINSVYCSRHRLMGCLRARLRIAIKDGQKSGSAVHDLGCSIEDLKIYLEQKFQPGMTWNNWGNGDDKWNIDHIRPLASFSLEKREDLLLACHYTNLQPLWWRENLKKNDMY